MIHSFQLILIRKLFIEGCAPKPIEENIDNDSEDNDNSVEYKSSKKKKKGKLYQIMFCTKKEKNLTSTENPQTLNN